MLQAAQAVPPDALTSLVNAFKELGVGVGFGIVCMWFYRKDVMQREAETAMLLRECMDVIKNNSAIIAEHTVLLRAYFEQEEE